MTGKAGLLPGETVMYKKATTAAMALRAACSGMEIKDYTHTHTYITQPPNSAVKVRLLIWYNARSQCSTN